jgi:hypothetical protein
MGVILDAAEIVDQHRRDIRPAAFDHGAQNKPADPPKPINRYFNSHA